MDVSREDQLINRVVEGKAGVADWTELEILSHQDPSVWRRLGLVLRNETALNAALEPLLATADEVELPGEAPARSRDPWRWSGWAAAAIVGVLWVLFRFGAGAGDPAIDEPTLAGGTSVGARPPLEELWNDYVQAGLDGGRVVEQLPRVTVDARPAGDGEHLEVLYLRRLLERRLVTNVYEIAVDESGAPVTVPVAWETRVPSDPL